MLERKKPICIVIILIPRPKGGVGVSPTDSTTMVVRAAAGADCDGVYWDTGRVVGWGGINR